MADSQYPYPPDRFDDEADAVAFHGAHRAEEPFWRQNLLYIIIIAAALVLLMVLLFLIGNLGGGGGGDDRASEPTTAAETTAEESAGEESASESAAEEPAPVADKTVPVLVMNAAGINGLAGDWRDTLEESGWEDVQIQTADVQQQEAVVFYRDEEDAETAQALALEVGAGEARQSDEYENRITFLAVETPADAGGAAEGDGEG